MYICKMYTSYIHSHLHIKVFLHTHIHICICYTWIQTDTCTHIYICVYKDLICENGKVGKYQECVLTNITLQNLPDAIILELVSTEGLKLPREGLDGKLKLISILDLSTVAPNPPPPLWPQQQPSKCSRSSLDA